MAPPPVAAVAVDAIKLVTATIESCHALETRARTACCGFKPETHRKRTYDETSKGERQLNRMWQNVVPDLE